MAISLKLVVVLQKWADVGEFGPIHRCDKLFGYVSYCPPWATLASGSLVPGIAWHPFYALSFTHQQLADQA